MGNFVIGMDWGGYDYDAMPLEKLAEAGLGFFLCQAGGAGTHKLMKRAKACGLITGLYYWNSALKRVTDQVDEFSEEIDLDKPDFIDLDFEHYWKVWSQYWDAIAGKLPWSSVERLPPEKISENGRMVAERLAARWAGKFFAVYSAAWFVNGYSPQASAWLREYPFHVASYPDYGVQKYTLPIKKIMDGTFIHLKAGEQKISDWAPTLPIGMSSWKINQYSSRIILEGEPYAYDWNYVPMSLVDFQRMIGLAAPLPSVEQRLNNVETRLGALEDIHKP